MTYNVALVSGVQQSESIIHLNISILFQILVPCRLSQTIEQISLCYTVGPCFLPVLYTVVCTCHSQPPSLSLPQYFLWLNFNFYILSGRVILWTRQNNMTEKLYSNVTVSNHEFRDEIFEWAFPFSGNVCSLRKMNTCTISKSSWEIKCD